MPGWVRQVCTPPSAPQPTDDTMSAGHGRWFRGPSRRDLVRLERKLLVSTTSSPPEPLCVRTSLQAPLSNHRRRDAARRPFQQLRNIADRVQDLRMREVVEGREGVVLVRIERQGGRGLRGEDLVVVPIRGSPESV